MLSDSEIQTTDASFVSSAPIISDLKPVMTGLSPAFRDTATGEVHLSRAEDGKLSQDHSFFHLPVYWISETAPCGDPRALIPTVEAGYWRSTGFIAITKRIKLPLDS